jgi:hypothetical protein
MTDDRTMGEITGMTEEKLRERMDEMMKDYTPPEDEALARFVLVQMYGSAPDAFIQRTVTIMNQNPVMKEGALIKHREFQEDVYLLAIALEETNDKMVDKLNG